MSTFLRNHLGPRFLCHHVDSALWSYHTELLGVPQLHFDFLTPWFCRCWFLSLGNLFPFSIWLMVLICSLGLHWMAHDILTSLFSRSTSLCSLIKQRNNNFQIFVFISLVNVLQKGLIYCFPMIRDMLLGTFHFIKSWSIISGDVNCHPWVTLFSDYSWHGVWGWEWARNNGSPGTMWNFLHWIGLLFWLSPWIRFSIIKIHPL